VPLITAIGASFFLQYTFRGLYGTGFQAYPEAEVLKGRLTIVGISILRTQAVVLVAAALMMLLLYWVVMKTKTGMAMRALSWDKIHAPLFGIDVDRVISLTFAIGTGLAGVAGIFVGLAYPIIDPYMGIMVGWKAFVSAVIGGIGSVTGAVAGGFLLGAVEILSAAYLPSTYRDMIVFGLLLVILLFKPAGLFGMPAQKKV